MLRNDPVTKLKELKNNVTHYAISLSSAQKALSELKQSSFDDNQKESINWIDVRVNNLSLGSEMDYVRKHINFLYKIFSEKNEEKFKENKKYYIELLSQAIQSQHLIGFNRDVNSKISLLKKELARLSVQYTAERIVSGVSDEEKVNLSQEAEKYLNEAIGDIESRLPNKDFHFWDRKDENSYDELILLRAEKSFVCKQLLSLLEDSEKKSSYEKIYLHLKTSLAEGIKERTKETSEGDFHQNGTIKLATQVFNSVYETEALEALLALEIPKTSSKMEIEKSEVNKSQEKQGVPPVLISRSSNKRLVATLFNQDQSVTTEPSSKKLSTVAIEGLKK